MNSNDTYIIPYELMTLLGMHNFHFPSQGHVHV